jgi:hypothetical protein
MTPYGDARALGEQELRTKNVLRVMVAEFERRQGEGS